MQIQALPSTGFEGLSVAAFLPPYPCIRLNRETQDNHWSGLDEILGLRPCRLASWCQTEWWNVIRSTVSRVRIGPASFKIVAEDFQKR